MSYMAEELKKHYEDLFVQYQLEAPLDSQKVSSVIKQSLREFLKGAKKPAIYCNGGHTKMLMADFVYELKKVRHIIDNYKESAEENGFILIKDEDIEKEGIDAIILSSYKFRSDIKESLKNTYPELPVLDIYDEFEKEGMVVRADYYYSNHPYQHYKQINQLQRKIKENKKEKNINELYIQLITKYIQIKDFRTTILKLKEWIASENIEEKEKQTAKGLLTDVETLYDLQKKAAASLSENHVLMFCMDGLRRQDLSEQDMPKMKKLVDETGYQYTNAYAYSTSTYESLVPVYSENTDFHTQYYEKNSVDMKECRFASLAEKQNRKIFIYGGMAHFVEGKNIHYNEQFLTVTEKFWHFILDASETEFGLFYIHELYESHFTYSNPYTEMSLISEGTALLFDFLPVKGGHLRTDYEKQHRDAIHYLDDVVEPLLRPMKCRMLIYADHGTLILDQSAQLTTVKDAEYTCSEGWTRIPLILCTPEKGKGKDDRLISLMELNNMVISMLENKVYHEPLADYIKMGRSELYNPDFQFLYRMVGKEQALQAFECFLFKNRKKLMIYANGATEIYDTEDHRLENNDLKELVEKVIEEVTVCEPQQIQV